MESLLFEYLCWVRTHNPHSYTLDSERGQLHRPGLGESTYSIRARLLLYVRIPSSIASANRFSSRVVRCLLLCVSITADSASAFTLACQPNPVLVENAEHANAGVDAYETPRHGHIKGATKANSERVRFPLTLTRTHKRSPCLAFSVQRFSPPVSALSCMQQYTSQYLS